MREPVRFINHSTVLPVNFTIEQQFYSILAPELSAILTDCRRRGRHEAQSVDIFFVSAVDLYDGLNETQDIERETDHPDTLGVYYTWHPKYGRSIIQVCPEKIMAASIRLKRNSKLLQMSLADIYSALTIAVVIHEIAHLVMDECSDKPDHRMSWEWLTRLYDDDPQRVDSCVNKMISSPTHNHCFRRDDNHPQWQFFIEESLANAIMIKQRWSAPILKAIHLFVQNSPPAYASGLCWKASRKDLISTSESWREHKSGLKYKRWFGTLLPIQGSPVDILYNSLVSAASIASPIEFNESFFKFVEDNLVNSSISWKNNQTEYDEMLNGVFGIFDWLCTQVWWKEHNLETEKLSSLLREWSQKGQTGQVESENFRKRFSHQNDDRIRKVNG